VVFWNKPWYNVNVQAIREVYSPWFPNMVLYGPRSQDWTDWTDYSDELEIDTYNDWQQGMPGRASYHAMKLAIERHPCYSGYLITAFDVYLNVPRLEHYPKDRIWANLPHSVNPVNDGLHSTQIPEIAGNSPDPGSDNSTWDWWWKDPNVGLTPCWQATLEVKLEPERFERLDQAPTLGYRLLLGGLSDAFYLPAEDRQEFLSSIQPYLQRNCFLEITIPTTLQLIHKPGKTPISWYSFWKGLATESKHVLTEGKEVDMLHPWLWKNLTDGQPLHNAVEETHQLWFESQERLTRQLTGQKRLR